MAADQQISLWEATAREDGGGAALEGEARTDLAIVGAGFTGLSAALHGAQLGLECHVLEAAGLGHGGSGRNVGLVNAGLWLPPQELRARLGPGRGARLIEVLGAGPEEVFALIERHQIRCEALRRGTIHAAHSARGMADLARRAQEWRRLGAPVDLLGAREVAELSGSRAFHGGLVDPRAGTINPMGYARGLARAARAAGARISIRSPVIGLRREGRDWVLVTPRGRVAARHVLLATNAYSGGLWPGLSRLFSTIGYFQLATRPLGASAAAILPGGQGLWDTGTIMISVRRDAAGRVLIGSMGHDMGALSERWARAQLRRLFPGLGPVTFEQAWHGTIAMTPDHLPRLLRLEDGLFAALGYNGRGIAPGTVFGRALAEYLAGGPEAALPLPLSAPKPLRAPRLTSALLGAAFAANQILRSL